MLKKPGRGGANRRALDHRLIPIRMKICPPSIKMAHYIIPAVKLWRGSLILKNESTSERDFIPPARVCFEIWM